MNHRSKYKTKQNKTKTTTVLEDNIGENLRDFGDDSLEMTLKALSIKENIWQIGLT